MKWQIANCNLQPNSRYYRSVIILDTLYFVSTQIVKTLPIIFKDLVSLNFGYGYSQQWTRGVGPCHSSVIYFISLQGGQSELVPSVSTLEGVDCKCVFKAIFLTTFNVNPGVNISFIFG